MRWIEQVLNDEWGTIGPKSVNAAKLIAQKLDSAHGLIMHSAYAAMETQVRALALYGDEVITASYGDPINAFAIAAAGATPVFADIEPLTATLSADSVRSKITSKTKAVIADVPGGNPCDAIALADICQKNNIKLIINLNDAFNASQEGKLLPLYSYGTVVDFADGRALSAGEAGTLVHQDDVSYAVGFAFHNCGRIPNLNKELGISPVLGGNKRIAEWQSGVIENNIGLLEGILAKRKEKAAELSESLAKDWLIPLSLVKNGISSFGYLIFRYCKDKNNGVSIQDAVDTLCKEGYPASRPWKAMHRQPVFTTVYFQKTTGHQGGYKDDDLVYSIAAENELVWIKM